jgi:hypothetical protein
MVRALIKAESDPAQDAAKKAYAAATKPRRTMRRFLLTSGINELCGCRNLLFLPTFKGMRSIGYVVGA